MERRRLGSSRATELMSIVSRRLLFRLLRSSSELSAERSPGRPATSPPIGPKSKDVMVFVSRSRMTTRKWHMPEDRREFRTAEGRRL